MKKRREPKIRVVIADDHSLFAQALQAILGTVAGVACDLDPLVRGKNRLERLGEHAVVVRDQDGVLVREVVDGGLQVSSPQQCDLLR